MSKRASLHEKHKEETMNKGTYKERMRGERNSVIDHDHINELNDIEKKHYFGERVDLEKNFTATMRAKDLGLVDKHYDHGHNEKNEKQYLIGNGTNFESNNHNFEKPSDIGSLANSSEGYHRNANNTFFDDSVSESLPDMCRDKVKNAEHWGKHRPSQNPNDLIHHEVRLDIGPGDTAFADRGMTRDMWLKYNASGKGGLLTGISDGKALKQKVSKAYMNLHQKEDNNENSLSRKLAEELSFENELSFEEKHLDQSARMQDLVGEFVANNCSTEELNRLKNKANTFGTNYKTSVQKNHQQKMLDDGTDADSLDSQLPQLTR